MLDLGMFWARCQDAAEIWHPEPDKFIAQFCREHFWLRVKASICIVLGREGGTHSAARTYEDIPVWTSRGHCSQGWEGPSYNWREVSVEPGWRKWRVYSYSNGY